MNNPNLRHMRLCYRSNTSMFNQSSCQFESTSIAADDAETCTCFKIPSCRVPVLDGTSLYCCCCVVQLLPSSRRLAHIWSVLVKMDAPPWRNDRWYSGEAATSQAKCHRSCSWPAPFRLSPHSRHGSLCAACAVRSTGVTSSQGGLEMDY